ncbi:MAG TPA: hypothetical protein VE995_09250 [Gaiellaceae bacterium]|nr:hypothetical protein [Gaiellaceae bacterium]
MKKALVFLVAALALPSAALAKPPSTHTSQSKAAPKVMYVLKGTFSNYVAPTSTSDGSITIDVSHSNYHGRALKGQSLTFAVAASTRITFRNGGSQISDGAKGMLKFRAPLRISGDLASTLTSTAKALHVIVQKAS